MRRPGLLLLTLALAACSSSPASPSLTTTPTGPASTPAATPAATPAGTPAASGPCIDTGQLADNGEPVVIALQGVVAALKIANTDQARTLASSASSGIRGLADLVAAVKPDAETAFRAAADALDAAAKVFPAGLSAVEQIQTDVESAFALARTAACPS
ncbi:MAG: hypothetical protein ACRDF7_06895 [Candidatus Limnocylindrales bacterium]